MKKDHRNFAEWSSPCFPCMGLINALSENRATVTSPCAKNTTDPAMGLFFYWKEKAMDWLNDYTGDIWYTDVIAAYEESKESEE